MAETLTASCQLMRYLILPTPHPVSRRPLAGRDAGWSPDYVHPRPLPR